MKSRPSRITIPQRILSRHRGFTLVELLVVITIIVVLAAVVMVVTQKVRAKCGNDASSTPGCIRRLREHLLAHLICPGRHTISGLITVFGKQFRDWSADYSLYSKDRVCEESIFNQVRKEVETLAPASRPLCVALDDIILRKTGKTIPGAAYRKDPLGPPFNLNLVWAQRRIQLSAAVADENHEVRMIPISFLDASTPRKPAKTALPEQVELYKERMKQRNLNTLARETLHQLQQDRAAENGGNAPALHLAVDGSYTNKNMLRHLPAKTTLTGRIRKDAKLSAKPSTQDLINELRRELWSDAIRPGILTDFMNTARGHTKPHKSEPNLCSTLFAATA